MQGRTTSFVKGIEQVGHTGEDTHGGRSWRAPIEDTHGGHHMVDTTWRKHMEDTTWRTLGVMRIVTFTLRPERIIRRISKKIDFFF